jgi:hypothetical protein
MQIVQRLKQRHHPQHVLDCGANGAGHAMAGLCIGVLQGKVLRAKRHAALLHELCAALAIRLTAALLLQQHHGQHVGGGVAHGDDVGSKGVGGQLRQHAEGANHVRHLWGHGQVGRQQRALARQRTEQELHALGLVPLLVAAQAQVGGDGVHRLGVLHALLPDVQLAQKQAKDVCLAEHIQQLGVGDVDVTSGNERIVAHAQRAQQLGCRRTQQQECFGKAGSRRRAGLGRPTCQKRVHHPPPHTHTHHCRRACLPLTLVAVRLRVSLQRLGHIHAGVLQAVVQHVPAGRQWSVRWCPGRRQRWGRTGAG